MLWSLLRSATQKGLSWNTPCLFQRSRFSGLCKTSSVRFYVISSNFRHGSHRRLICTRCYRELDIAKGAISRHTRCLKFLSSLLPNVNRRFVGTRVSLNSTSASNMRNKTTAIYTIAIAVAVVGLSYLAVPLYRLYCQVSQCLIVGQFMKRIICPFLILLSGLWFLCSGRRGITGLLQFAGCAWWLLVEKCWFKYVFNMKKQKRTNRNLIVESTCLIFPWFTLHDYFSAVFARQECYCLEVSQFPLPTPASSKKRIVCP